MSLYKNKEFVAGNSVCMTVDQISSVAQSRVSQLFLPADVGEFYLDAGPKRNRSQISFKSLQSVTG